MFIVKAKLNQAIKTLRQSMTLSQKEQEWSEGQEVGYAANIKEDWQLQLSVQDTLAFSLLVAEYKK